MTCAPSIKALASLSFRPGTEPGHPPWVWNTTSQSHSLARNWWFSFPLFSPSVAPFPLSRCLRRENNLFWPISIGAHQMQKMSCSNHFLGYLSLSPSLSLSFSPSLSLIFSLLLKQEEIKHHRVFGAQSPIVRFKCHWSTRFQNNWITRAVFLPRALSFFLVFHSNPTVPSSEIEGDGTTFSPSIDLQTRERNLGWGRKREIIKRKDSRLRMASHFLFNHTLRALRQ